MLRSNSQAFVAAAGGTLSLLGEKAWLAFDWLFKHTRLWIFDGSTSSRRDAVMMASEPDGSLHHLGR